MKTFVLGLFLTLCVTICTAEVGTPCTEQSQCAADECCQIVNIVIASKKRQLSGFLRPNTSGTCEKYSVEGDICNSFDVLNGYCSCAQGLKCKTVQVSTVSPILSLQAVSALRRPAPGYVSFCSSN